MSGIDTCRVLIADDAPEMSKRIAKAFLDLPVEIVGIAADGYDASLQFALTAPDVAIVDLQMPGKGGIELVRDFRSQDSGALLILLTSHDSPEFRQRAIEAGADHFVSKKMEFERIVEFVQAHIERTFEKRA